MSHATDDVVASILNELKEAGVTTPGEAAGYFKREKIMRKSQKGAGAAAGAQDEDEDELEAFRQELADAAMGSGGQEKAAERRAEPSSPSDESSEDEDAADEVAAFKASLTGESPEVYREREDASTAAPGGEGEFSDTAKAGFEKALISGGQTPPEEHRRKEAAREDMTVEEQKQALLGVSDAAKSEPTTDHAEDDDLDKIFKEFLAGAAREAN